MNSDRANPVPRLDAELVKRAQQGDADAFATLFCAHKARIYSLCLRMTNNTAEAEVLRKKHFCKSSGSWPLFAAIPRYPHGYTASR